MQACAAITPDTHAKYLLINGSAGSTGHSKVVINVHRMPCANQQMLAQTLQFLAVEKLVLLGWAAIEPHLWRQPQHERGPAQRRLHAHRRRPPMPGLLDITLTRLRQMQPTIHFNVSHGGEVMLPTREQDDEPARRFLRSLRMMFYAGPGMPPPAWQRLQAVALRVRAVPLWPTTSRGRTETAPANTFVS